MTPWSKLSDTHEFRSHDYEKDTVKRKQRKKCGETPVLGSRDRKKQIWDFWPLF